MPRPAGQAHALASLGAAGQCPLAPAPARPAPCPAPSSPAPQSMEILARLPVQSPPLPALGLSVPPGGEDGTPSSPQGIGQTKGVRELFGQGHCLLAPLQGLVGIAQT